MTYDAIFLTETTDTIESAIPPIGAYKCAHVLRKNGYRCLVIRFFSWYDMQELKEVIDHAVGDNTKLIGFSTTFLRSKKFDPEKGYQYDLIPDDGVFPQGKEFENEFIEYCRILNPEIKFAAGGSKVNINWQNRNMDYAFLGFSEDSVVALMDHLSRGKDLKYSHRNIWGVTIMDDRTAPGYDFRHDRMEWLPEDVVNAIVLPIEIGRGCIFRCKFCSYPLNGKKNLDFVKLSEILHQEMENNYNQYGVRDYVIVDDTFNDHVEKLKDLADMVQRLPFRPRFWGYHRLDLICTHPETLPMLNDIGIRAFYFGIETLDLKAGRTIGKGFSRKKQIEMVRYIRDHYPDISTYGSFIAGLPHESLDSVKNTCRMLENQDLPLHCWIIRPLNILLKNGFPSDMDQNWQQYGYRDLGRESEFGQTVSPRLMNWENDYTNLETMTSVCQEFMDRSISGDVMHLSGQSSLSVSGFGDPDWDFDRNFRLLRRDVDFHAIETQLFAAHLSEYKRRLLSIIKK